MSTATGRRAEEVAAEYLRENGFFIESMNWRSRRCEIDIVAKRKSSYGWLRRSEIAYIIEVKYRSRADQGIGLEYITERKRKQLILAAQIWAHENDWSGDIRILGVSVTGTTFKIESVCEIEAS